MNLTFQEVNYPIRELFGSGSCKGSMFLSLIHHSQSDIVSPSLYQRKDYISLSEIVARPG